MNAQADTAARLKEALAKLDLMDEVAYQATRQKLAEELGCELRFLDKSWKRARAARLRVLNRNAGARSPQQVNVAELLSRYGCRYEVESHPDRTIYNLNCGFKFPHHRATIVQRTDDATVMPVYKCLECPEKTFLEWRLVYDPGFEERERAATAKPEQDPWADAPFVPLGMRSTDPALFCKVTNRIVVGSNKHSLLVAGNADFFR